jgi:membrane protein implicated in regulation of membrane protease activity
MVGFTLGVAIVVGAVISLATGSWWFLILAIAMHALGTTAVLTTLGRRLQEEEKPDPVMEARLAEEPDEAERERLAS